MLIRVHFTSLVSGRGVVSLGATLAGQRVLVVAFGHLVFFLRFFAFG